MIATGRSGDRLAERTRRHLGSFSATWTRKAYYPTGYGTSFRERLPTRAGATSAESRESGRWRTATRKRFNLWLTLPRADVATEELPMGAASRPGPCGPGLTPKLTPKRADFRGRRQTAVDKMRRFYWPHGQ